MSTNGGNIMQGVQRFLSRREKNPEKSEKRLSRHLRSRSKPRTVVPPDLYTILTNEDKQGEKEDDQKVKTQIGPLVKRLEAGGITRFGEEQADYALTQCDGNQESAYDLLLLAADSFDGILKDFDPNVKLLGAENRNSVTCYLDALLFSMFARLDSFEAMLFDNFNDEPRKKLAAILRLWVNLLRTGRLIRTDFTKHLQDALAKCGWEAAAELSQQDSSEAFTFITGALELPLLTLKMDIYHTGKEDQEDDHKFVNERLLEVAIPDEQEANHVITLEECLEMYFNNRIEVKRHLQRQNTLSSIRSTDPEKDQTVHIESVEVSSASNSPVISTPTSSLAPVSPLRPIDGRRRADSIFSERYVQRGDSAEKKFDEKKLLDEILVNSSGGRPRSSSLRKEVMMPAWQFFSLIPWYTDNVPKTDSQVAAHFSARRPILGICLKRYYMLLNGTPKRRDTFIDIPLEIGLPHFVSDDRMEEEGPLFGNFKLVLQSVVCHRGVSVDSGHYVSLVRANLPSEGRPGSPGTDGPADPWMRFDDLAGERVTYVDIKTALKEESPYLLFYQVQPIDEDLARGNPPSYDEAQSQAPTAQPSLEDLASLTSAPTDPATATDTVNATDAPESERSTVDISSLGAAGSEDPIGRTSMSSNRRSSVAFEELEPRGRTAPATPSEEVMKEESGSRIGFLSAASRRNSRSSTKRERDKGGSKSRPTSQNGESKSESRLSLTLTRLTGRGSKDKLQVKEAEVAVDEPVIVVNEIADETPAVAPPVTVPLGASKVGGLGRSKSKRKGKDKEKRKSKSDDLYQGRPDRECVVM